MERSNPHSGASGAFLGLGSTKRPQVAANLKYNRPIQPNLAAIVLTLFGFENTAVVPLVFVLLEVSHDQETFAGATFFFASTTLANRVWIADQADDFAAQTIALIRTSLKL